MSDLSNTTGVLGSDPLDARLGRKPQAWGSDSWWVRHRLAGGLSATPLPGVLLVIGLVLGPQGVNLISPAVLSSLGPAVSTALAGLGLLLGLALDLRAPRAARTVGLGSAEALTTFLLVAAGVLALGSLTPWIAGTGPWLAALAGACAAASSRSPALEEGRAATSASRAVDVDDLLPIVLGGFALVAAGAPSVTAAVTLVLQHACMAAAVAGAGWLLLSRPQAESGQQVFTAGVVLLLGGLAEFQGASALLNGLLAGVLLGTAGGVARERLVRDLGHVQHPLLVLLLLVAGASVGRLSPAVFALVVTWLVLRVAAKLGSSFALRFATGRGGRELARQLISPGVTAAALALDAGLARADPNRLLLAVAVVGAIFSELVALGLRGGRR